MPGALIFLAAAQDMIFDYLALESRGTCIPDHTEL